MIPEEVRDLLNALRFDRTHARVAHVDSKTLDFADRAQLTPLLTRVELPGWARERAEDALRRNAIRLERVAAAYSEIAFGFDHIILKGFTHVPDFVDDGRLRTQYDLDLYVPPEERTVAIRALETLGYEPVGGMERLRMDHLPTMIRKTGWEWRGDYFDPEIPVAIEVHFRFWDEDTELLYPDGLDQFVARRNGTRLHPVDRLGYAALHLARHLLRGNVRVFHVWELARFLHTQRDRSFWKSWTELHTHSLREIEAVAFLLANRWFGCELSEEARRQVHALPTAVHLWFDIYGWSPVEALFHPNKHELLLHLSLASDFGDRLRIVGRRLIPGGLPAPVDALHLRRERMTLMRRIRERWRYLVYLASRVRHHARLLAPTLWSAMRWRLRIAPRDCSPRDCSMMRSTSSRHRSTV